MTTAAPERLRAADASRSAASAAANDWAAVARALFAGHLGLILFSTVAFTTILNGPPGPWLQQEPNATIMRPGVGLRRSDVRRAGSPGGARACDRRRRNAARRRPLRRRLAFRVRLGTARHIRRPPIRRVSLYAAAGIPNSRPGPLSHSDLLVLHAVRVPDDRRAAASGGRRLRDPLAVGGPGGARPAGMGRLDGPGDGQDRSLDLGGG